MPAKKPSPTKEEAKIFEEELQQIIEAIKAISNFSKKLEKLKVKKTLIILLIHDATGLKKSDIKRLLDMLPTLEKRYLK